MNNTTINDLTFKNWMVEVDRIIARRFGITSSDLADTTYWDMWNDEMTPAEAADEALSNDDLPWLETEEGGQN